MSSVLKKADKPNLSLSLFSSANELNKIWSLQMSDLSTW